MVLKYATRPRPTISAKVTNFSDGLGRSEIVSIHGQWCNKMAIFLTVEGTKLFVGEEVHLLHWVWQSTTHGAPCPMKQQLLPLDRWLRQSYDDGLFCSRRKVFLLTVRKIRTLTLLGLNELQASTRLAARPNDETSRNIRCFKKHRNNSYLVVLRSLLWQIKIL